MKFYSKKEIEQFKKEFGVDISFFSNLDSVYDMLGDEKKEQANNWIVEKGRLVEAKDDISDGIMIIGTEEDIIIV